MTPNRSRISRIRDFDDRAVDDGSAGHRLRFLACGHHCQQRRLVNINLSDADDGCHGDDHDEPAQDDSPTGLHLDDLRLSGRHRGPGDGALLARLPS